ncbi:GerAB/ArcD/ProY family transporter [Salsuginibacillus kocurii]|uniref:GerAB/ArcD/ProY family transporter n=1 Tax=Salsuginibacillus kocurii TaxID=427078 RepID=UPI00036A0DB4|nr:endospore germination permease [Salsuginibacillus kocurii]
MIEQGKISSLQMAIFMYPAIIATGVLLIPSITAVHAGRDMWISPIWGSFIGFATVYIAYKLHTQYPGKTVIQYSEDILGKLLGKMLGLIYLLFYLHITGIVLREYSEFILGIFFLHTPIIVILGSMILVGAFAVRGGVEVIARASQICTPIVVILLLSVFIFLSQDLEPRYILPIFEEGITPSLKGALTHQAWFSEFFLISFFLPFLADGEKSLKWSFISVVFVMLTFITANLSALFLFGDLTAKFLYPLMSAARYISIADFIEQLESLVMAIWVAGAFVKLSVFYYALSLGTAQWLNLSEYKSTVFPLGILLVVVAIWSGDNLTEVKETVGTLGPFYLTSLQTVLPLILLLFVLVKKKVQKGAKG